MVLCYNVSSGGEPAEEQKLSNKWRQQSVRAFQSRTQMQGQKLDMEVLVYFSSSLASRIENKQLEQTTIQTTENRQAFLETDLYK